MFTERTSVGLDVHARSVAAAAIDGVTGEVFKTRLVPSSEQILGWVRDLPGPVAVAYEAGPTGFGLARSLTGASIRCEVVAPSKLQRPAGDRVKTDARDALHLAKLLRLDEYTPVRVPSVAQEAARDLVRAREAARSDLMRARHRCSKLLLRHGIVYYGGKAWTHKHDDWLLSQRFDQPGTQAAFEDAYEQVVLVTGRRDRLDAIITAMAADSEFTTMTRRLGCLRGIGTLTGFALAVEINDWDRFTGASIGAYLGLVPSEHSSGATRAQGAITKTGNTHVRRLLVEAAWHHRKPYRPTAILRRRWEQAPPPVVARAQAGNRRLHQRWAHYAERKKRPVVANVAVARELAGWCWSLATMAE
ncbi:IS110 family transposase [Flexivirga oryzae]|uniref:IS110 family transposase n=1 Tax=Flexivirga oryzae TaxID=1794944 RepID=UPI0016143671